eukprot:4387944-Alexandrium_andersonii.AAC.1
MGNQPTPAPPLVDVEHEQAHGRSQRAADAQIRAEDTRRVATQGNLQGITFSAFPVAAPMPTATPRPEPRLLTRLPTLDSADERGQQTAQARSLPFVRRRNE